ncbi:MAG: hypothetical protein WAP74_02085 [Patescibacteria group bacterium]
MANRTDLKLLLAIVVIFGLIAVAVGFFNLGIKAEQDYRALYGAQR